MRYKGAMWAQKAHACFTMLGTGYCTRMQVLSDKIDCGQWCRICGVQSREGWTPMVWAPPWLQLMSSGAIQWQGLACTPTLREAWASSLAQTSLRCD